MVQIGLQQVSSPCMGLITGPYSVYPSLNGITLVGLGQIGAVLVARANRNISLTQIHHRNAAALFPSIQGQGLPFRCVSTIDEPMVFCLDTTHWDKQGVPKNQTHQQLLSWRTQLMPLERCRSRTQARWSARKPCASLRARAARH